MTSDYKKKTTKTKTWQVIERKKKYRPTMTLDKCTLGEILYMVMLISDKIPEKKNVYKQLHLI